MVAMAIEPPAAQPETAGEPMFQTTRELFDALPPLPGFRVELIEGNLLVSPLGSPEHSWRAADLHDALFPLRKERGWSGSPQGPGICIEGPRDSASPDYVLSPPDCNRWGNELLSSGVIMAAEIVSPSSIHTDRVAKLHLYALGKIPVYLLIDPIAQPPVVTVYSNLQDGEYRTATSVAMGKVICLPSPIDFELDTSMIRA
ncbi:Uma2 family endonuclease [Nonomuraea rubra]|uniref:Uma2 family endonuclease n=1 Tax=Nonomuraea rubra TaxID=46180 RepID=A0A7X0NQQ1_9ACTN|nr:Uma2 family endonuclease [Nonomuraea rubra]MBB6547872.1 Uma2 family endonuclease [Nonomuraea rubra]